MAKFFPRGGRVRISVPNLSITAGGSTTNPLGGLPIIHPRDFYGALIDLEAPELDRTQEASSDGGGAMKNTEYDLAVQTATLNLRSNHPLLASIQFRPGFRACCEGDLDNDLDVPLENLVRDIHYIEGRVVNNPNPDGSIGGARPTSVVVEVSVYARLIHYPDGMPNASIGLTADLPPKSIVPQRFVATSDGVALGGYTRFPAGSAVDLEGGTPVVYTDDSAFEYMIEGNWQGAVNGAAAGNPLHRSIHTLTGRPMLIT